MKSSKKKRVKTHLKKNQSTEIGEPWKAYGKPSDPLFFFKEKIGPKRFARPHRWHLAGRSGEQFVDEQAQQQRQQRPLFGPGTGRRSDRPVVVHFHRSLGAVKKKQKKTTPVRLIVFFCCLFFRLRFWSPLIGAVPVELSVVFHGKWESHPRYKQQTKPEEPNKRKTRNSRHLANLVLFYFSLGSILDRSLGRGGVRFWVRIVFFLFISFSSSIVLLRVSFFSFFGLLCWCVSYAFRCGQKKSFRRRRRRR